MNMESKSNWKDTLEWRWDRFWRKVNQPFRWLRRHIFNRNHWHLIMTATKFEPWDWYYQTELEKAGLERMIAYHKQSQLVVGWERIVREMETCCRLIDIFNETEDLTKRMPTGRYIFLRAFNSKNAHRFVDRRIVELLNKPADENGKGLLKKDIYRSKAQYLYHKIRFERERTWWD